MTDTKKEKLSLIALRLAALWVAAGALFKLFAGTPLDLPPNLLDMDIIRSNVLLFFRSAIAIELSIVLLTFIKPRLSWLLMIGMLLTFVCILTPLVLAGEASCGCFGSSGPPPWVMLAADSVFLVGLVATRPWSAIQSKGQHIGLALVGVAISFALPFVLVQSDSSSGSNEGAGENVAEQEGEQPAEQNTAPPEVRFVDFRIKEWIGKTLDDPEVNLKRWIDADVDAMLNEGSLFTEGSWIFYRITCDHCREHIEQLAMNDDGSLVTFLRIHEEKDKDEENVVKIFPEGPHVTHLSLKHEPPPYLLQTPADLTFEAGVITEAREGIE